MTSHRFVVTLSPPCHPYGVWQWRHCDLPGGRSETGWRRPARDLRRGGPYGARAPRPQSARARRSTRSLSEAGPAQESGCGAALFGGLSVEDAAVVLGVSTDTVMREWK